MSNIQTGNQGAQGQVTRQAQDILNTILKCFDVPFITRTEGETIRFGAYRHKENSLTLAGEYPRLILDLRDPERLLGKTLWNIAHNYSEAGVITRKAVEDHWNDVARKSLKCDTLSVTGYQDTLSNISITFDLRNIDESTLKAVEAVLTLTHLEVKGTPREEQTLH